ncbi:MAG TPA: type IV pilin-like G/H family protein [Kamptonema sp.]|nr:type IV pilin-like G/H family protein [Kamptonema sp.]
MTMIYLNLRNLLIVLCLLPLSIGSSAIAQQSPTPTLTQSPNPASTNSRTSQFVGQWRLKDYLPIPLTVIFTQDGKLFVLLPSYLTSFSSGSPSFYGGAVSALEFRYKINSTTEPMQIDVTSPGDNETIMTIFEFTSDGQLRIEWDGLRPGESRPNEFTAGAIFLQRVSNTTALPRNTKIIDFPAPLRQGRESEGRQYINAMNRAQQAFYAENEKFTTVIDELGLGIKTETENYSYQIVPQSGSILSVMMTAKAKSPELKSYTGAVFVIKVDDEVTTVSIICGTDKPSTTPPAMPIAPQNAEDEIKCPAGSSIQE